MSTTKDMLARKLDILEFIMKRDLVWAYELEDEFGYSPRSVAVRLSRLKKQGLIINMTKGCWELSEERLANASGLRVGEVSDN